MAMKKHPQRRQSGKNHHSQHQQRAGEHHPQRVAEIRGIHDHKTGSAGPEAGHGKRLYRQSGDQPRHAVELGGKRGLSEVKHSHAMARRHFGRDKRMRGKRELLVEGRCTGKKRDQHREREGAGKYGKLWSQVTYQVGSRSALMDSIGRFILGGPEFRLMAQAPGIAKPAGPIGTQVR